MSTSVIDPDKVFFPTEKYLHSFHFSMKTYVVGTH